MPLSPILSLVAADFQKVNANILSCLESHVEMIQQISHYLVDAGGKRIRPLVTLLSARACGVKDDGFITMAGAIEFIHNATLLHDDVVDDSKLRRGRPTANQVWDNASVILVGDFLYTRAFQMMVSVNSMPAMHVMAEATNRISEGEVLQLAHRFQPDIDEDRYLMVVRYKTAKLFEAAAQLGAILNHQSKAIENGLATYGLHLGTAFQIVDDMLDYSATDKDWGKGIGDDLAEGKVTMPLIYAMKHGTPAQQAILRETIQAGKVEDLKQIQAIINETGALAYTMNFAKNEIKLALEGLDALPASQYKDALITIAEFAISRVN
jgi:octaprenyl-diphosphate synthase